MAVKGDPIARVINARHDQLPYQVSSRTNRNIYARPYGEEVRFAFNDATYPTGGRGWWR